MPDAMSTIFISYAHSDSAFVDRLEADLRQRGFALWLDRRGLAAGKHWRSELQEAIDRAAVVLVVLSPEAVASQFVQAEYGYATEEGKVVIPLYYRPCKIPLELRPIQWVDFQHSYEAGLQALVESLSAPISASTAPAATEAASRQGSFATPLGGPPPLEYTHSMRPTGTVTFLLTDIEGSSTRWEQHPEAMRAALVRYEMLLRSAIEDHGGFVFKLVGEAVSAVFAVATDAIAAAIAAQRAVAAEPWGQVGSLLVRMALHTGSTQSRDNDYFGPTLNRVAGMLSTGYGGQILLSSVTFELVRDSLPEGVSVKDLGEHVLKDLLRPEHIYQLTSPELPSEFPPLKSLSRQAQNLPMQPTPLVGREQEIRAVCELLCQPEVRLVTLTGPAGIGKTRLALQVGAELSNLFADGIFLVSLAPVSDPEQVAPAIIQALGITGLSGQASLTLLKAALKDKQMLLLLDNFEQVMAAAVQVAELLATCPKLKILVTSQVVLRLQAEHEFALSPLSVPNPKHLPDLGTLSQYDAVALFIQRAQAIKPDFSVNNDNAPAIAGICARLDGLPLAIELAAARVKFFSPQALFARLEHGLAVLTGGARDLPARQQTLRGAIAWSYNLLLPEEQQLFRRLAVFVNGCSWEATNEVCRAAGELVIDTLDGLLSLVDKSLLRQQESAEGEPRFWMLQTLREFGLEILTSTGEIELTRQGHADYYLRLAEAAEPHVRGPEQTRWFTQLEQEYENLRAAVTFLLERARVQTGRSEGQMYAEQAMRLCAALYWFWVIRGYVREGRAFLEQALAERGGVGTALQSRALYAAAALHVAGDLAWTLEDTKRAEVLCGESLTLSRALSDKEGMANCMRLLGSIARMRSQFGSARTQLEEAAALFDAAGDHWQRGRCLTELGRIATDQGQYEQARTLLEESLALYQRLGDQQRIGWVQYWLARLFFVSQEDPTRALHLTEQSLALLQAVGNWQRAYPLSVLGHMHLLRGEYTRAGELLEESLAIHKEVGDGGHAIDPRIGLARLSALQGDLKAALRRYQECLAILYETAVYKDLLATSLEGWATVVVVQGVSERAARLWGTAEALRETIEAPMHPVDRLAYGQTVAAVRTQLGEEAFVAACDEGRTTPLEQVLDEVLRTTS